MALESSSHSWTSKPGLGQMKWTEVMGKPPTSWSSSLLPLGNMKEEVRDIECVLLLGEPFPDLWKLERG